MKTKNKDKYLDSIEIPDILTPFSESFGLSLKEMLENKDWPLWSFPYKFVFIFLLRHLIKQEKKIDRLESYIDFMEKFVTVHFGLEEGKNWREHGQTKTKN